ncbi:hypothetical protein MTO96_004552 [Rhipicephalus appendiculatus]
MPDPRRLYRFRDHAVSGVNWRPTRFVDEGTPKEAVDFVHWTTSRSKEFNVSAMNYPPRRANALKVYCWNEAKGCKSEGTMEDMLRHYENECTFHTVECLRCGDEVLHRELATHYVARCSAADSLAGTEKISSESGTVTFQDVMGALEEVKALWRDANCEQLLLLEIQTRMNELVELIRNRESRPTVKTEVLAVPSTSKIDQVAAPSPSTSLQEGTSKQNSTEQASSSSTTPSCSQETLMARQLEPLVDLPKEVLQAMRKTSWEDYPRHAVTYCIRNLDCHLELMRPLSTFKWRELLRTWKYVLTLANIPDVSPIGKTKLADITVLHSRDAYFTVKVYFSNHQIFVVITFHGMCGDPRCSAPVYVVRAYDARKGEIVLMRNYSGKLYNCEHDEGSWIHCQRVYHRNIHGLVRKGVLPDGMKFEIELCHN